MTSMKPLSLGAQSATPWSHPARSVAAASLKSASAALARLAQRLAVPAPVAAPPLPPVLEFYADAGAPEGALYLDGQLVGWVPGVRRL
jgi:hypothetical protein